MAKGRALGALGILLALGVGLWSVYDHLEGDTHPTVPPGDVSAGTALLWSGALHSGGITVVARLLGAPSGAVTLEVAPEEGGPTLRIPGAPRGEAPWNIQGFEVQGLEPGTAYTYTLFDGADPVSLSEGTFRTPALGPQDFKIVLGSCADTGSRGEVFDVMAEEDPLLYLQMGDLHYLNIAEDSPERYLQAYGLVHASPSQSRLYRRAPIAYMWDDHDYGGNDSDRTNPGRRAVRAAYDAAVPHYPFALPDAAGPIAQAFSLGRVRFILTDLRSQRDPLVDADGPGKTHLGAAQLAWLKRELEASAEAHPLIVLLSTVAWIGEEPARDGWVYYQTERRALADAIAELGLTDRILMVSGDAHMLAFDDGTNTGFASSGGRGFPVFHAAALDRFGSVKGGPYSGGAFPGGGHYGLLTVTDSGAGPIEVRVQGKRWDGAVRIDETLRFPRGAGEGGGD